MKTKITSILTKADMMLLTVLLTMTAQTAWAYSTSGTLNSGQIQWVHDTENKTLTFTGTGGIPDKTSASQDVPWDKSLVEKVVIGSGITRIGKYYFKNHTNLKDVTFEENCMLTEIAQCAFASCTGLTSISIPASVTNIINNSFENCTGLTSVTIGDGVTTIGSHAFRECTNLETCNIMSSQLTSIPSSCFSACSSLKAIAIPEGVTTIGDNAFNSCTSLQCVILPGSLQTINGYAFSSCSKLKTVFCKVVDPQELTIAATAFNNATEFYLSSSADISAWNARGFSNLTYYNTNSWTSGDTDVTLDFDGTLTISKKAGDGNGAMNGSGYPGELKDYIKKVVIESGVTTIGNDVFSDCTALTSVTIPNSVTTIGNYAFMGCSALSSVTIPDGVTTIGNYAFRDCTALTSVTIPASVTTIESGAFMGCTGLTSVTIADGVTTIGNDAFRDCTALTSVTIPASVTTIGNGAFRGCTALTSVTIFAPSLTNYETLAFAGNAADRKIFVPSGSVDTYKTGWNDYATAIEPLDYIIDEDKDVSILSNGTGKNVALKRAFPKGKKQTVCLPFAPGELLKYGKVWEFTGISGDNKAVMTQRESGLQANTPYIFEATNDLLNITFPSVGISIGNDPKTADATAGFTFHGTYTQKHWLATSDEVTQGTIYGFMAEDNDGQATGQFVRARRETFLRPFSCYLEYNGALNDTNPTSQAPSLRSPIEALPDVIDIVWQPAVGSTTEITTTDFTDYTDSDAWYTLSGTRLNGKPSAKGLYIVNGRKVVIK